MPWPTTRRVMGTRVKRLDGPAKVTGAAKYAADVNLPGLCYAVPLYSPHGHARVTGLATTAAEALPGVKLIRTLRGPGQEVRYHGEYVALVVAETEDQARDAARAVQVSYEPLPALPDEVAAMAPNAPKLAAEGNTRGGQPEVRGTPDQAFAAAAAVYEGTFRCPTVTHVCLESHGATAAWDGDKVTVWASTQGVSAVKEAVAGSCGVPRPNVEIICDYMGGGFGGKLGPQTEEVYAAQLARQIGRPVKLLLDREQEHTHAGCRESVTAKLKVAADREGRLVAWDIVSYGSGGVHGGARVPLPYLYRAPNVRRQHTDVAINAGSTRAMRAPGHPSGSFLTEMALEGLVNQLGLDPAEVRARNSGGGHAAQIALGRERIGWQQRQPTGSQTGRRRVGYGLALTGWGGAGHDSNARVVIHADGAVEIYCGTQDIGTGSRTAVAVVAAETLGLRPEQITSHVGHGSYPASGGSGGSTTIGGIAGAARVASEQALAKLFERLAPALGVAPAQLAVGEGTVLVTGGQSLTWAAACAKLGPDSITVEAARDRSLTGGGTTGVQLAQVEVDCDTGIVRVRRIVALQSAGSVVNRLTCESQIYGGVIMGLAQALFEERVLDPATARMLNPNLEFYKLPGASDIPVIDVVLQDQPDRPVIGIGEPPIVCTAAAIGCAVWNAIGHPVRSLPLTPDKVLAAVEGREVRL